MHRRGGEAKEWLIARPAFPLRRFLRSREENRPAPQSPESRPSPPRCTAAAGAPCPTAVEGTGRGGWGRGVSSMQQAASAKSPTTHVPRPLVSRCHRTSFLVISSHGRCVSMPANSGTAPPAFIAVLCRTMAASSAVKGE